MRRLWWAGWLSLGFGVALAGSAAAAGDPVAGQPLYERYCAACHGIKGRGNGPAAAALRPRPIDMSEPVWQRGVSDDYLRRIIRDGGTAVGRSPQMAPWGFALNERQLEDVVAYLRALAREEVETPQ